MRRLSCLALLLASCTGDDPLTLPPLLDPAPFHAAPDHGISTQTGLDAVPLGVPVPLSWEGPGTPSQWRLEPPAASSAVLTSPTDPAPAFTPDAEGLYRVTVSVSLPGGGAAEETRVFTAAVYTGGDACASCHVARGGSVARTAHPGAFERHAAALVADPDACFSCHVLDPVPVPSPPPPGGFHAAADALNFDPATDFTDFASFERDFPELARLAGVQCESCHGPGGLHASDPRRIGVTLRARACLSCHDGTVGADLVAQWGGSPHAPPVRSSTLDRASCRRCHTAPGYLAALRGEAEESLHPAAPAITCAVCHDAHEADHPALLREFGLVPVVSGGPYDAGRAAACVRCHQSEIADAAAHAAAAGRFPFSVQADMLAARGAVEFGRPFGTSFHGTTVFRLRPFTGDPDDSDSPDACVICHMAPAPPLEDRMGGHAMRLRIGAETLAAGNCDRCHAGLDTFDRNLGRDFDGDGVARGVQTEVKGLVEILWQAIRAADTAGGVTRPDGALTKARWSDDLSLTTPLLRQAVYNHNFVVDDGSFGVHNTTYAVQLLQHTYEELTGTPFGTAFPGAFVP